MVTAFQSEHYALLSDGFQIMSLLESEFEICAIHVHLYNFFNIIILNHFK